MNKNVAHGLAGDLWAGSPTERTSRVRPTRSATHDRCLVTRPRDFATNVDRLRVDAEAGFEIVWASVTGMVDLMLDWDLTDLDITIAELADWLGVSERVAASAVASLGAMDGVEVSWAGTSEQVRVVLDLDSCPLTAA